ncbi:DNA polymerase III subunit delta [Convivina intestini]|uniref:DNA polymerase III subunit delta n=1 Tax=Convivina intestini TaxID=1505726 RepID=UPI00200FE8A5|nr:DNA polymerase III subunit delta [Convivina intestini]CAH1850388.1 putative protein YqeN [Convivina intestini]
MKLSQLQDQIKQDSLASLYLVEGQEGALLDQARRLFMQTIPADQRDLNYSHYDLAENLVDGLLDDLASLPFLGERRLIMVDNPLFLSPKVKLPSAAEKQFLALIQNPIPGNILVLMVNDLKLDQRKKVTKTVATQSEKISLPLVPEGQIRSIVTQRLNAQGYGIDDEALKELMLRTNASYTDIMTQLDKLKAYAKDSRQIDLTAIQGLVPKSIHTHVFDLTDAVMRGRVAEPLHLYRELVLNGEAPLKINALLLNQFRLLLQVAGLTGDQASKARLLNVHPYRIKLAQASLSKYRPSQLRTGYLALQSIEIALKSSQADPALLFEEFILKQNQQ